MPPRPPGLSRWSIVSAWMPWGLLTAFVFIWGLPEVKKLLNSATVSWPVPGLHNAVARTRPIVPEPRVEEAEIWISSGSLPQAQASWQPQSYPAFWLRVSPTRFVIVWWQTVCRLRLAPGDHRGHAGDRLHCTRYSGMDSALGICVHSHRSMWYPLFAALPPRLGVALTGSDTASNATYSAVCNASRPLVWLGSRLIASQCLCGRRCSLLPPIARGESWGK